MLQLTRVSRRSWGAITCLVLLLFFLAQSAAAPRIITQYSLTSANDFPGRDPRDWKLLGSSDGGANWVLLDQRTNQLFVERFETKSFPVTVQVPAETFRLEVTHARDAIGVTSIQIADIDVKGMNDGKEGVDLRPSRNDLVLVQGENAPVETRRMAFDGNAQTKWLDFSDITNGQRSTWIQWQYDTPPGADPDPVSPLRDVVELNLRAHTWAREPFLLKLSATVLWSDPEHGSMVIQDHSGAALVRVPSAATNAAPMSKISLAGSAFLVRRGGLIEFHPVPVVNNDGLHGPVTKSALVYLRAGRHPISAEWFNREAGGVFDVELEGPGIPKQRIPDSWLYLGAGNAAQSSNGLAFEYFEGAWEFLPLFSQLAPVKQGVVNNFSIQSRPRNENCGMTFAGFLEVPRDGEYRFYVTSDDGGRLFIGDSRVRLEKESEGTKPVPARLPAGSVIAARDHYRWISLHGEVVYAGEGKYGWELALESRSGTTTVYLGPNVSAVSSHLLGSRVRVEGICVPTIAADEHLIVGELITPDLNNVQVTSIAPQHWRGVPVWKTADANRDKSGAVARFRGWFARQGEAVRLEDETGVIQVFTANLPPADKRIFGEALGQLIWKESGPVLRLAEWRELGDTSDETRSLPLLRAIEQVHGLPLAEAKRGYPVRVRGVVTCAWPDSDHAVVQDGTRGIYIPNLTAGFDEWAEIGDYFEIEGRSDPGDFAPIIIPERVARLGKGALPDPVRPTWAQLINGSMDAQFAEVRGVVSSVEGKHIWLLMRGGRLRLEMETMSEEKLKQYENSIVRLRGCFSARWNNETRKVIPGELRMNTASISVERDAPSDLFAVPSKRAGDLLLFDAHADDLQRIKVSGQFLGSRKGVYYLLDGETGVRFVPKRPIALAAGDFIQVVGFPRAEGPAVVLRDATARRVPRPENSKPSASSSLPPAKPLTAFEVLRPENDATRVSVQARLLGVRTDGIEEIMELQHGHRTFVAYVLHGDGAANRFPVGSLLEVAGILVGRGSTDQRRVDAFDLLICSTADIKLLERPSWWTLKHSAGVAGATIIILLAAGAWIRSLRGEVLRKTLKLRREIEERKNAEEVAHRARRQAEAAAEDAKAGSRAKSQFLATMSHEIRTPMNGILGMNNLLLDSGLSREQRDLAETVSASGEALLSLLNDILDFSKIEAGKLSLDHSEFCLRETVEGAIDLIAARAQTKKLELNYWIDDDVPTRFRGDAGRFRQVLLNLLSNSVKFTEEGEVFLEVSGETREGKTVLKVTVRDTGIGIAPEMQDRVFLAFEQADQSTTRKYGGTGLGLAICKRLVELMGGTIGLESTAGVGTTFWFTIPLEHIDLSSNPSHEHNPLAGVPLLLVERHPTTARVLRDFAAGWKMPVQTTASFDGIADWINSLSESVEKIVLVDAASGAGNVLEAIQQLRTKFTQRNLRFGLITSLQGRPAARDLNRADVHTCLTKPVRRNQFRSALLQLVKEPHQRPAIKETSNTEQLAKTKSTRILLAEDNIVNQRVAQKQLARLGYSADVVSSGVQVLEAVARQHYDVILMDCQMPEMDGYEATKRLRQLPNSVGQVRIIAMTANAMHGDREKCIEAGMDDYVSKPVKIEDLRAALERGREPVVRVVDSVPVTQI